MRSARSSLLVAAATLVAAAPLYGQAGPAAPVTIPITVTDGILTVPASAGTAIPLRVILDTGAGLDVLAPSLVARLHGRPAGTFTAHRMTGERLDVPLFVIRELSVGPLVRRDVLVGAWDMLDTLRLDGIVSANGFREQPFTIDFAGRELIFETAASLAARRSAGHVVALALDDYRGVALDLFTDFLLGDNAGQCELDTGSQGAAVSLRYLAPLGIDTTGPGVTRRQRRTIAGAPEVRYNTRLPAITLAGTPAAQARPGVSFMDLVYDCVIGTDFWTGRRLTIDIGGRALVVSDTAR